MPDRIKLGNVKTYRGDLSLDWHGKDYAIIQGDEADSAPGMVPPPGSTGLKREVYMAARIAESAIRAAAAIPRPSGRLRPIRPSSRPARGVS